VSKQRRKAVAMIGFECSGQRLAGGDHEMFSGSSWETWRHRFRRKILSRVTHAQGADFVTPPQREASLPKSNRLVWLVNRLTFNLNGFNDS